MKPDMEIQQRWDDGGPELKALRRLPRVSFTQPAWAVRLDHPSVRHSVVTQDISQLGVGFWSIDEFVLGSRVVLAIETSGWERRRILCVIRRCRFLGQGFYAVGAEFEAITEDMTEAIPSEWLEWAKMPHTRVCCLPVSTTLNPELIPGVFSAPVPVGAGAEQPWGSSECGCP